LQEGTALGKSVERGETVMPSADRKADEWEEVVETLEQVGVARYEVSNFARRPAARSRHNVAGWRGLSYAGVGPGAHGRLERDGSVYETVQIADPHEWAKKAAAGESASAVCRRLSAHERIKERVIMALRSVDGLDAAGRAECAGALEEEGVREVQMLKLISTEGGGLRATNKGLNLLDSVLLRILK
jgi:coproporphyrinogen III oxidase-like Fe-S oxidoreductase